MQTSAVPAHHDGVSDVLHCVLATRVEELVPLAITLASLTPDDRVLVIAPDCLLATLP